MRTERHLNEVEFSLNKEIHLYSVQHCNENFVGLCLMVFAEVLLTHFEEINKIDTNNLIEYELICPKLDVSKIRVPIPFT